MPHTLKVTIEEKRKEYKIQWLEHLQRMSPERIPKQVMYTRVQYTLVT
jgi:hypothetical protein